MSATDEKKQDLDPQVSGKDPRIQDPDPYQNFTYPQHWLSGKAFRIAYLNHFLSKILRFHNVQLLIDVITKSILKILSKINKWLS